METIENIGLYLKGLREEQKFSVAQVAQVLRTKPETILALEANEFHKIPAPTYVKGYLRSYANYLGIDFDYLVGEYNRQYPIKSEQILVLEGHKLPRIGLDIKKLLKPKAILFAGVIISIIAIISLFLIFLPKKGNIAEKVKPVAKEVKETADQKKKPVEETPAPGAVELNAITLPMFLTAHPTDNVWVRVFSDEKLIFEGTLRKNEEENWRANKEIKLRLGNPGKVKLTLNGKPIKNLSPYGPLNITINENGIKTDR